MSAYTFARAIGRVCAARERRLAKERRERRLVPVVEPLPDSLRAAELELSDMAIPGPDEIEVPGAQALSWLIMGGQLTDLAYVKRCVAALRERRAAMTAT